MNDRKTKKIVFSGFVQHLVSNIMGETTEQMHQNSSVNLLIEQEKCKEKVIFIMLGV